MSGNNGYPFLSKRDVVRKLDDASFVRFAIDLLHRRFVDRDILSPPAGWMASDRKRGEEIHARLAGPDATAADLMAAAGLAKRYSRQIATHLRIEAISRDPRLVGAAAVFGVRVPDELMDRLDDEPYPAAEHEDGAPADGTAALPAEAALVATAEDAVTVAPSAVPPAPPPDAGPADAPLRRRGRPKGSRNRVKSEPDAKPKKRRRRS